MKPADARPPKRTRAVAERAGGIPPHDGETVWANELIGQGRLRAYGIFLLALSTLVSISEGYDIAAMSLAAPLVAKAWDLHSSQTGILFSVSVIGLVLGSFLLSPVGDRRGRRFAIIVGLIVGAVGTGGGALAQTYAELLATRLIAGAGLGMALPNTITLAMELVPDRMRSVAVVLVSTGLPLGGGIGAAVVGPLVEQGGHAIVFAFGAIVTAISLVLVVFLLPESPLILVRTGADAKIATLLRRLVGHPVACASFGYRTETAPRSTVGALMAPQRRTVTLLLWLLNFAIMGAVYFLLNWTPTLVVAKGLDAEAGIMSSSLLSAAGIIGAFVQVWLLSRLGPVRLLIAVNAVAVLAVIGLTWSPEADGLFFVSLTVVAAALVGAQFCLNAIVAQFYPATIRATGTAFATGAGRVGAIIAPAAAGLLFATISSTRHAFAFALFPIAIALLTLFVLWGRDLLPRARAEQ